MGGAAGGGRRPGHCGALRASRLHVAEIGVPEAEQGGSGPAADVLAMHYRVSRAQIALLIAAQLADQRKRPSRPFRTRSTREDILHLAETDPSHDT